MKKFLITAMLSCSSISVFAGSCDIKNTYSMLPTKPHETSHVYVANNGKCERIALTDIKFNNNYKTNQRKYVLIPRNFYYVKDGELKRKSIKELKAVS